MEFYSGATALPGRFTAGFLHRRLHTIEQLQLDLDNWLQEYNEVRPHQGRWC